MKPKLNLYFSEKVFSNFGLQRTFKILTYENHIGLMSLKDEIKLREHTSNMCTYVIMLMIVI